MRMSAYVAPSFFARAMAMSASWFLSIPAAAAASASNTHAGRLAALQTRAVVFKNSRREVFMLLKLEIQTRGDNRNLELSLMVLRDCRSPFDHGWALACASLHISHSRSRVRAPGLQERGFRACRPRALTRRGVSIDERQ